MASEKPSVLFCCLGNIIRSPLCEGLMRHRYGDQVIVDSAAVTTDDIGRHPQENAQLIAKRHGFDISSHVARLITKQDFEKYDIIVALAADVYSELKYMKPNKCRAKIVEFAPRVSIINPWYEPINRFEAMFDQIEKYWPDFIKNNFPNLVRKN